MPAQRTLKFAFLATLIFAFVEFVGGKLSHSLALVADAAHLLTDAGALGLVFFASWIASQPATRKMSYGFHRVEILAALVNGAGLITIAVFLVLGALRRFASPPEIQVGLMIVVGTAGLLFNLFVAFFLNRLARKSLNVKSAFYHVLSDLLGSVGVVGAGIVIWKTGWKFADPVASLLIALLVVWGAWQILRQVVVVLLEAAPSRVNIARLESRLLSLDGVQEICDLHVWTISSGKEALSVHLGVRADSDADALLRKVNEILSREFGIHHTTIQVEKVHEKPHKPHGTHRPHEF